MRDRLGTLYPIRIRVSVDFNVGDMFLFLFRILVYNLFNKLPRSDSNKPLIFFLFL